MFNRKGKIEPKYQWKNLRTVKLFQKFIRSALLPKGADVNIWTNKPWHLNRMVTYFEKVMFSLREVQLERSEGKVKSWPMEFGLENENFFRTVYVNFWSSLVFQLFLKKKTNWNWSRSAPKKKLLAIGIMFIRCVFVINQTCEEEVWLGQKILCCTNGSAIETKDKNVWVREKRVICGGWQVKRTAKTMSVTSITIAVISTILYVGFHITT